MLALGEAVAASQAKLALEEEMAGLAVKRSDPEHTPPTYICIEGPGLSGVTGGFAGFFKRQPQREMEGGAPAYKHCVNPVLWLARDMEGCWRGQVEGKLGQLSSLLKLADKSCLFPCSTTDEPWQSIDTSTRDCAPPPLGLHLLSRLLMIPQCDTNARVSATQFTSPSHAHASITCSRLCDSPTPSPH